MKGGEIMPTKKANVIFQSDTKQLDTLIKKLNRIKELLIEVNDMIGSIQNIDIQLKVNGQKLDEVRTWK